MKIRNKIILYFSTTTLILVGVCFLFIYFLFGAYREEEFQLRQKEKIANTLNLLSKIKDINNTLIEDLDLLTINDLYDEKLLLFDFQKKLIYSSIDDVSVPYSSELLSQLNSDRKWIEKKDGKYDVVAYYLESKGSAYYGISKAFDTFGYSKLNYLKIILILSFISISTLLVIISFILSKKITQPLDSITHKIKNYNFEENFTPLISAQTKNEVSILAEQFNKLMKRIKDVLSFQKHAVHHISHELKTPISILVSNFEKIEATNNAELLKDLIKNQKEDTKRLSEIIDALLEIAKTESGKELKLEHVRIDEIIFDIAENLKMIYPNFTFFIDYSNTTTHENQLTIKGNELLIKTAFTNLFKNAIQYNTTLNANILISSNSDSLEIKIQNEGDVIDEEEYQYLFQHFFRGQNSKGKNGFGLGLVYVYKIISLHGGNIVYNSKQNTLNQFKISLPLS